VIVVVEVALDVRDLGVSRADLVAVASTGQELVGEPLAGKAPELAGAVVVSARANCSRVSVPGRWQSEYLVDRRPQWHGARSAVCEVDCSLDMRVWQKASLWLAVQAGLLQAHSLSKAPCWHSLHRQSHLECSCCLFRG
jgi:hypothetical protein